MQGDDELQDIIILVLEVMLLIIKIGVNPEEATRTTANKHGVEFSRLWENIPPKWRHK
ncbi:MAG: hypothetical protein AB9836_08390 [Aminipila sp.]